MDYFGYAHGDPNENYQIKTGWFANISNVYDPHDDLVDSSISPVHNPFGYIYDPYDYTVSESASLVKSVSSVSPSSTRGRSYVNQTSYGTGFRVGRSEYMASTMRQLFNP